MVLLSLLSIVLSLGAPGIGWVVAVVSLALASFLSRLTGKKYVAMSLMLSIFHLFSFGPLAGMFSASNPVAQISVGFLIGFVALPFTLAVLSLLAPVPKNRKKLIDVL
ncbi:hypothetical protein HSX11_04885 [Oxalobacteraceae bacterium]|nr:hypothetical protein [Oxalobacteraceae bacterium]